jgi:Ca-activated chloride channel homolog
MKLHLLIFSIFLFSTQASFAQEENQKQNSSPYFHIETEGIDSEDFPLLSTTADVNITGPIASVTVTQTYKNDGSVPIEAVYVFPASTRAAVYEMSMYVGDRVIKAEIQEKNQAKRTYEKAKSEGKRASLLAQSRPNVFQMNVGNILPGDLIKVELKYNEFLIPENKVYSFVYPTVVGPRFGDAQHMNENAAFVNTPYSKENVKPTYDFDIKVALHSSIELKESFSPSHNVTQNNLTDNTTMIRLDEKDIKRGNKDFIFNYSFANDQITKGAFLYEHGDENFFLTMVEPPKRIVVESIPPREYIFIVDVSGSMFGFPIDISKGLMKDLVSKLKPNDKFNVLLFSGGSRLFAEQSVTANEKNLNDAFYFIDNIKGGGGTQLLPALERALALPTDEKINSRSIVVVTDGYVHVEREAFELIANNLNKSNLFAFGIGAGVNRHLIEGMAHAGQGEAFVITDRNNAEKEAERFRVYIEKPLLTNIQLSFENFDAYDVSPKTIPDLLAERPLYIFGKYKGAAKGKIKIKGYQGLEVFEETIRINSKLENEEHSPIRYLWAREKIRWLDDLNSLSTTEESVKEVTNLGLKYNLLTNYTSFVAVEETPVLADGSQNTKTVKQVLPLPEGVSNHAVGFEMKIEEVVLFNPAKKKSNLFVHISGGDNRVFNDKLKSTMLQSIEFSAKEKSFLNNNTLTIRYDKVTNQWFVSDTNKQLTEEFKIQFTALLQELSDEPTKSFTIQINMLWV